MSHGVYEPEALPMLTNRTLVISHTCLTSIHLPSVKEAKARLLHLLMKWITWVPSIAGASSNRPKGSKRKALGRFCCKQKLGFKPQKSWM